MNLYVKLRCCPASRHVQVHQVCELRKQLKVAGTGSSSGGALLLHCTVPAGSLVLHVLLLTSLSHNGTYASSVALWRPGEKVQQLQPGASPTVLVSCSCSCYVCLFCRRLQTLYGSRSSMASISAML